MSDTPANPFEGVPVGPAEVEVEAPRLLGGVPEGYFVNREIPDRWRGGAGWGRTPGSYEVPARYREGDQFGIYQMDPAEIAALQDSLVRAGLLDPLPPGRRGFVGPAATDPTFAAFEQVLSYANQAGHSSVGQALAALGRVGRTPEPTPARLPPQVSNADDLRRVFRAAVIGELGRGWSNDQIEGLVSTYQSMEAQQQNRQADLRDWAAAGGANAGGTIEQLPTPETFAANAVREADPVGVQGRDFLGAANQFFSLLGQWSPSQAPGELPGT